MSLARRQLLVATGLGLGLAGLDAGRRWWLAPTHAVRDRPPVLRAGFVRAEAPAVQWVRLPVGTLHAVEWTVLGRPDPARPPVLSAALGTAPDAALGPDGGPSPAGTFDPPLSGVLDVREGPDGVHRLRARFDPPLATDGRDLRLALGPAAGVERTLVSPVLRVHAAVGTPVPPGEGRLAGPRLERLLRLDHDRWTALAIPCLGLPPDGGPVRLTIRGTELPREPRPGRPQPRPDAAVPAPGLGIERRVERVHPGGREVGHLLLSFPPLEGSRGTVYRLELELPPGAVVAGAPSGFACTPFHGALAPRAPWLAARVGGAPVAGASLTVALWHRRRGDVGGTAR